MDHQIKSICEKVQVATLERETLKPEVLDACNCAIEPRYWHQPLGGMELLFDQGALVFCEDSQQALAVAWAHISRGLRRGRVSTIEDCREGPTVGHSFAHALQHRQRPVAYTRLVYRGRWTLEASPAERPSATEWEYHSAPYEYHELQLSNGVSLGRRAPFEERDKRLGSAFLDESGAPPTIWRAQYWAPSPLPDLLFLEGKFK